MEYAQRTRTSFWLIEVERMRLAVHLGAELACGEWMCVHEVDVRCDAEAGSRMHWLGSDAGIAKRINDECCRWVQEAIESESLVISFVQ